MARDPGQPILLNGHAHNRQAFSLLEVLVSVAIFLAGALLIVFLFPQTLRASKDAELQTKASFLAQMKAEEIRRDDDTVRSLATAIARLREPTDAVVFTQEPELSYAFSSYSYLYRNASPPVPEGDDNVARVLILRSRNGVAPAKPWSTREVLYELRFAP